MKKAGVFPYTPASKETLPCWFVRHDRISGRGCQAPTTNARGVSAVSSCEITVFSFSPHPCRRSEQRLGDVGTAHSADPQSPRFTNSLSSYHAKLRSLLSSPVMSGLRVPQVPCGGVIRGKGSFLGREASPEQPPRPAILAAGRATVTRANLPNRVAWPTVARGRKSVRPLFLGVYANPCSTTTAASRLTTQKWG
jgi:hypothetical protein